jgi:hypothetical protein
MRRCKECNSEIVEQSYGGEGWSICTGCHIVEGNEYDDENYDCCAQCDADCGC